MKIGQIVHMYRPHTGGIENYVYRLQNLLTSQGHKVTVYTTDLSLADGGAKEENAIYCKTNLSPLRNPLSLKLNQRLAASNEDIYHLHEPWFLSSLIATRALRGRPKVMTVHGAQVENRNLMIAVLNFLYHPLAQYILGNMDMLMPQGEKERQQLLTGFKLRPDKIIPLPNGIEIDKFQKNDEAVASFIHKYNLRYDSFKILYISRLVAEKNPDKLVGAVTRDLKGENIEVILIGRGSAQYIGQLKEISDSRIHILGEVAQEELVAAYHSASLFVFLGLWEGMPTVILEAMACGLPILTTPVAAIPDAVAEGENGLFISTPVNENDLAGKIAHFMKNIDIVSMGKANALKVRQNYAWDSIGNRIIDIYEQVLSRRYSENQ